MRHAFLISAHTNWWQLKNLISLLDDVNHDIYVHVDLKSSDFDETYFYGATQYSKLFLFQEYKVYWGGYSLTQVEMFLFERAHERKYDYYHVMSGLDLPLKTNEEIDCFFEKNKGKEFIYFDEEYLEKSNEIKRRTRLYHFFRNYRRGTRYKVLNRFFDCLERGSLTLQLLLGVNRVRKLDWKIKYGSNWVSITNDLVECLLKNREKIERVFSYTSCSDELFVQTVAYNCGFKEKIYQPRGGNCKANLRCINWEKGKNGNPYTFRMEDYEWLVNAEALFARKFSETIDIGIIKRMSNRLL